MKVRRIEISGFKSFQERAVLEFDKPITAIAGPNGCGKSNVVDAFLWVMGERRARVLRGRRLEDVIFSGTGSHGPAGTAEVCVTFDNHGGMGPGYLSFPEIAVMRRLIRAGQSEYFINKVRVLGEEVDDLLKEIGIGPRCHTILEQGRVGAIMNASARERRDLIDEVARITKYRQRRHLAERKMEATEANIRRLEDLLGEVKARRSSLERQRNKAERFKRYRVQLREIEKKILAHHFLSLRAELAFVSAEKNSLDLAHAKEGRKISAEDVSVERMRADVLEKERAIRDRQREIQDLEGQISLARSKNEFHGQKSKDLIEDHGRARQRLEEGTAEIDRLERLREKSVAELFSRGRRIDALQSEAELAEEKNQRLAAELSDFERAIEEQRIELGALEGRVVRVGAETDALKQRQLEILLVEKKLDRARTSLQQRIADFKTKSREIKMEADRIEEARKRKAILRRNEASLLSKTEALHNEAERELDSLRSSLASAETQLQSLRSMREKYEGFGEGTREIMKGREEIFGQRGRPVVVADILRAKSRLHDLAVESFLGGQLDAVAVDDLGLGVKALDYLKRKGSGRATIVMRRDPGAARLSPQAASAQAGAETETQVISAREGVIGLMLEHVAVESGFDQLAVLLLGDAILVRDLEVASILAGEYAGRAFVTLDGEIVRSAMMTGGAPKRETAGLLRQKRELQELETEVPVRHGKARRLQEIQGARREEIARQRSLVSDADSALTQTELGIAALAQEMLKISAAQEALEFQLGDIEEQERELKAEKRSLVAARDSSEMEASRAAGAVGEARGFLSLLQHGHDRTRRAASDALSAQSDLRVALARASAAKEASKQELKGLELAIARNRKQREDLVSVILRRKAHIDQVGTLSGDLNAKIEILKSRRDELKSCHDKDIGDQQERLKAVSAAEKRLKEGRERAERLLLEASSSASASNEIFAELRNARQRAVEQYREPIEDLVARYHLVAPAARCDRDKADALARSIRQMGEINLTAIEESRELSRRLEFLEGQKGDLEQALSRLRSAITKINRASRQSFSEHFERIDGVFQKIFSRLFPGGASRLALTEASDVLEAGLEILAQPSGKRLTSIDMMSGGEKALTAIGLALAIVVVRPTPLCILDEVDASLDDANTLRFRELLRDLARGTRFILITHNRLTMESCDHLYGVTMQDPGVSKVVSVELSAADIAEEGSIALS